MATRRQIHRVAASAAVAIIVLALPASCREGENDDPGLAQYLATAIHSHPALQAADAKADAASERGLQAATLDAPRVTYERMLREIDVTHRIQITQDIPWWGTISARSAVARHLAEATRAASRARRLSVTYDVIDAYGRYWLVGESRRITEEALRWVEEMEAVVRSNYTTGTASYADLLRVRAERDMIRARSASLADEQPARSAALARAAGLNVTSPLPVPSSLPEDIPFLPSQEWDVSRNPSLSEAHQLTVAAEGEIKVARAMALPELMVGVSGMLMNDMGRAQTYDIGIMVGARVPLWRQRYTAATREASAMARAARAEQTELARATEAELALRLFEYADATRQLRLLRESLIPTALHVRSVTLQEYSAGRAGFAELVDAERNLLDLRSAEALARVDAMLTRARVRTTSGDQPFDTEAGVVPSEVSGSERSSPE